MCCCGVDLAFCLVVASCIVLIVTDTLSLYHLLLQTSDYTLQLNAQPFLLNYSYQIKVKILLTVYGINTTAVCLLLTLIMMIFDETNDHFTKICQYTTEYMSVMFGPVLFAISATFVFDYDSMQDLGWVDLSMLAVCIVVGGVVCFGYSLTKTTKMADYWLQTENNSIMYRVFTDRMTVARANRAALL